MIFPKYPDFLLSSGQAVHIANRNSTKFLKLLNILFQTLSLSINIHNNSIIFNGIFINVYISRNNCLAISKHSEQ